MKEKLTFNETVALIKKLIAEDRRLSIEDRELEPGLYGIVDSHFYIRIEEPVDKDVFNDLATLSKQVDAEIVAWGDDEHNLVFENLRYSIDDGYSVIVVKSSADEVFEDVAYYIQKTIDAEITGDFEKYVIECINMDEINYFIEHKEALEARTGVKNIAPLRLQTLDLGIEYYVSFDKD